MVHPQPEDARQSEAEPPSKRRSDEPDKIVEHWDGLGDHHSDGPDSQSDE